MPSAGALFRLSADKLSPAARVGFSPSCKILLNEKWGRTRSGTVNSLTRQPNRFRYRVRLRGGTVAQQRVSDWLRIDLLIIVVGAIK
jgi:hypothetical protein